MKNLIKFIGIIALAAVIGFSMTSCEEPASSGITIQSTSGSLTITGLDAYNGKHAMAFGFDGLGEDASMFFAYENISTAPSMTLGTVSGGQVTLKVWEVDADMDSETAVFKGYSGNDDVLFFVIILETKVLTGEEVEEEMGEGDFA